MSYLKNWRKYRAEAEAVAKSTDDELSSNSNQDRHFEINAEHDDDNTNNSESQNSDVNEVIETPDQDSFFSDSSEETASNFEESFENVPSFQSQELEQDLASWQQKTNAQDQLFAYPKNSGNS